MCELSCVRLVSAVAALAVLMYVTVLKSDSPNSLSMRFYIALDIFSGTASVFHFKICYSGAIIAIAKPYLYLALPLACYYCVQGLIWGLSLVLLP